MDRQSAQHSSHPSSGGTNLQQALQRNPRATHDLESAVAKLAELLNQRDLPQEEVQAQSDSITEQIIQQITQQIAHPTVVHAPSAPTPAPAPTKQTPLTPREGSRSSLTPSSGQRYTVQPSITKGQFSQPQVGISRSEPVQAKKPQQASQTSVDRLMSQLMGMKEAHAPVPTSTLAYQELYYLVGGVPPPPNYPPPEPVTPRSSISTRSKSAPRSNSVGRRGERPQTASAATSSTGLRTKTPERRHVSPGSRIEERLLAEGELMRARKEALQQEFQNRVVTPKKKVISEDAWKSVIDRMEDGRKLKEERLQMAKEELTAKQMSELTLKPFINRRSLKIADAIEPMTERLESLIEARQISRDEARKRLELEEAQIATHRPEINERSQRMTQRSLTDLQKWDMKRQMKLEGLKKTIEDEERMSVSAKPEINSRSSRIASSLPARDADAGKRLFEEAKRAAQVKKERELQAEAEFQPHINPRSARVSRGEGSVGDRLYMQAMQQQAKRLQKIEKAEEIIPPPSFVATPSPRKILVSKQEKTPLGARRLAETLSPSTPLSVPSQHQHQSFSSHISHASSHQQHQPQQQYSFSSLQTGAAALAGGSQSKPVTVVDYDPKYDDLYKQLASILQR